MKKRFTFDTIHRDSFPRQFVIRFATEKEKDDSFETLEECKEVLNKSLPMDILISLDVLNYKPEVEITYVLGDDSIDGTKLNEKIRDEQLHEYSIIWREDLISDLIRWIAESNKDSALMRQDMEMLMSWEDDYIFSSNSTNAYIRQGDSEFDETCKELLELNETL